MTDLPAQLREAKSKCSAFAGCDPEMFTRAADIIEVAERVCGYWESNDMDNFNAAMESLSAVCWQDDSRAE